jgi:hypothetical protein
LKKKPRTGATGKEVIATGSLLTPLLDDVSFPCLPDHTFFYSKNANFLMLFFCVSTILQPVMKEMVDIGSRFIGFRDETDYLNSKFLLYILPNVSLFFLYHNLSFYPEALHLAEKHANELEKKRKASEKACKKS